jgi:hypothetical protein
MANTENKGILVCETTMKNCASRVVGLHELTPSFKAPGFNP